MENQVLHEFQFTAHGNPATKGSYKVVSNRRTGKALLQPMNNREKPWRALIANQIRSTWWAQHPNKPLPEYALPAIVFAQFYLPKPKTVRRMHATCRPDVDKLLRCLLDGLTDSHLIKDDSTIITTTASKQYATSPQEAGDQCHILWITQEEKNLS